MGIFSKQGLWSNPMCDWCLNWKKKIRIFLKFKKIGLSKRNDEHLKTTQLMHFLKCQMNIGCEGEY